MKTITLWTTAPGAHKVGDAWPLDDCMNDTYFWPEEAYADALDNAIGCGGVVIRVTAQVIAAEVEWAATAREGE